MGTYDFERPDVRNMYDNHYVIDVLPWITWGNSPQDTTTAGERNEAFRAVVGF